MRSRYHAPVTKGFALITALLLMIGLTLLGVAALRTSIFDEKAAGNTVFRSNAHNYAEAALRAGELYINATTFTGVTLIPIAPQSLPQQLGGAAASGWATWDNTNSIAVPITGIPTGSYPRYAIEFLDNSRDDLGANIPAVSMQWFRVTARATDPTTGATVMLQQTVRKLISEGS